MTRTQYADAPFQGIRQAARLTGLSQFSIRSGCRDGKIPHIKVGSEYRVHIPSLLEMLENEAARSVGARADD